MQGRQGDIAEQPIGQLHDKKGKPTQIDILKRIEEQSR